MFMTSELMQQESTKIVLTAAHVRAARGLLHWSLADLAQRSGVAVDTINKWENGKQQPRDSTREAIRKAFSEAGVIFTNGKSPGVRLEREP